MSIDDSKHSVFGASKVAADIMCQEYGKYFDLPICTFRGGCLTGPSHSGTALHGYLAYLTKCIAEGIPYTIFGYRGKQVRDNIHSADLIRAFYEFYKAPRRGEAYNMGGSRFSNISMMEAIEKTRALLNRLLGATVSIVTPKAQTTRERVLGILTEEQGQIVFIDTPGIHRARAGGLNAYMVNEAVIVSRAFLLAVGEEEG